jgi:hypothetical protein
MNTGRYVEITPDHYQVYSVEYGKILQAVGIEIEVVCNRLCACLEPSINFRHASMEDYRQVITAHFPRFYLMDISVDGYKINLQPWIEWHNARHPLWWEACENIRYNRFISYKEANLQNTLNALAALMGLLLYYFKKHKNEVPLVFPKLMDCSYFPSSMIIEEGRSLPDFVIN